MIAASMVEGRPIMTAKFFISYRREDAAAFAGRLYDRLEREFGHDRIFFDVDTIVFAADFVEAVVRHVEQCDVVVAVIGKGWIDASDKSGRRRLKMRNDLVRIEIATALKRNIPVIPVLLDGTPFPRRDQLPRDLAKLPLRHGLEVRNASFHRDVEKLIEHLAGLQVPSREDVPRPAALHLPAAKARRGSAMLPTRRDGQKRGKTIFVSHPNDIAVPVMKRLVAGLIKSGWRVWLYDPHPYGFSSAELKNVDCALSGRSFLRQTLEAADAADAVLFLISRWTLQSKFQKKELEVALKNGRLALCIVDAELDFKHLPKRLRDLLVRKFTDGDLDGSAGIAKQQMLLRDLLNAAAIRE